MKTVSLHPLGFRAFQLLLLLIILLGAAPGISLAGDGSVPDIRGNIERYHIVAGSAPDGGAGTPTLFRIDIFTGKVWMLQAAPLPDKSGSFPVWVPTQEMDGDLYREAARTWAGSKWGKRPFEDK